MTVPTAFSHQNTCVVSGPKLLVLAQISQKLLAPPVTAAWVCNRRKSRHGSELFGPVHRKRQCPVPAHRMASHPLPPHVQGKCLLDQPRQFIGHIAPHPEMRRPGVLGRIHIEPRTLPQIIGLVIRNAIATRRCIGKDQRNPGVSRPGLRTRLGHCIFMGAGQTRQIPKNRHIRRFCLFRKEHREGHVASAAFRCVCMNTLNTAKTRVFRNGFHHDLPKFSCS